MIIAILKEIKPYETRVAATPQTVKKYIDLGFKIQIETNAGELAGFSDEDFKIAGADIKNSAIETVVNSDIIIKINAPLPEEIKLFNSSQIILANFNNTISPSLVSKHITGFALEKMPRISRAQNMDILSSQNNLAGYQAVIKAFSLLPKVAPLMMTAAGTITPAKVLILGVGVAGLQAIATAKRLGAVVYASDVRPEVKEQVESLGGKFISIETNNDVSTSGGYVKNVSSNYLARQKEAIIKLLPQIDVVITSALVIGKKAPVLLNKKMLKYLPQNSVVVDMASSSGGNVEGSVNNQMTKYNNLKIFGGGDLITEVPNSASHLFAQNIFNFINFISLSNPKKLNFNDEIITATCVCKDGKLLLKD